MENTRYKILLIEDDQLDQMAFNRFVESNDIPYDCTISSSVSQAKQTLNTGQFDIIITDHSLGDGTAFDILESAKNTPVIVVTGAGDEETAVKAWKAGAYDYLVKDINQNYLKAIPITVENTVRHNMVEKKLQLLSGAVMSTDDSIYITDMQGKIVYVNKAFCKTYGYKEEEIVGQNGNLLWIGRHQSQNTRSVFQTKTSGSGWEVGFYHRRKDNSVFPVSLSRSNIKDTKGRDVAIVGVARDITERIIIEDELRTESVKLKNKMQLQNDMTALVTETLQRLLDEGNIETAKRVVSDYSDISKIDADKVELDRQMFNFTSLASQAVEAFMPLANEKNINLKNDVPDRELIINADYDRMAQVLINLLSRAIKLSPENAQISLRIKDTDDELRVEIQDEGQLLERNEIHRIINRPDLIKEQFNTGKEDLILGLRIAKEFIEMHGGQIWAENSENKQNIFCFTVPKSDVRQESNMQMSSADAI
ncbi:MAG: PAS domain S-box protein [Sedimentisphaerales bacterium]|nr:PAS domain S-box protein [Sedimentisphaerales bacterium]